MNVVRPRFSLAVWLYLVTFFSLLGLLPIILAATMDRATASPGRWLGSIAWPVVIAVLWVYANRRCSSEHLRYSDGLLWVTASMMTGWVYMSFVFVLPVLLLTFTGSVLIALYGDIRRTPADSQTQWRRLVRFFYRNRMKQK
jgi:hypothetical protein